MRAAAVDTAFGYRGRHEGRGIDTDFMLVGFHIGIPCP